MSRVLIITRSDDNDSVLRVAEAIRARGGTPLRFDTDCYPQQIQLSTEYFGGSWHKILSIGDEVVDLNEVTAVYHRRFFAGGRLPADLGDLREVCVNEARRTLYATIASLGCFELDRLRAVREADHKELQLARAAALGLNIPRSLFSNAPDQVRRFVREAPGQVICKMLSSFAVYRGGQEQVVYTNVLKEDDLAFLDGLRFHPMLFQDRIEKAVELRATVVGNQVFTASIDSQRSAKTAVDWRRDGVGLLDQWRPYRLPVSVERALIALVRSFGLHYAAADLIVNPAGEHVFLEINAGGEWFWLARSPGLPIAEALADALLENASASLARVCA